MSSKLRLYVAGGVTSNLYSALIPSFEQYNVFATVRNDKTLRATKIQESGVTFITTEEALNGTITFDRVLWLSTHDDPELLSKFSLKYPTLVISSGAIMDFYRFKQTRDQLNAYQESKLALMKVPGVYAFVPGFYIADIPTPSWASKGLHGDTTGKLFGDSDYTNPDFDWGKCYSVTPLSFMVKVVNEWIDHPQAFEPNTPIIVCSDRQYRRWELRNNLVREQPLSKFLRGCDTQPDYELVYLNFFHAIDKHGGVLKLTEADITNACHSAAELFSLKS